MTRHARRAPLLAAALAAGSAASAQVIITAGTTITTDAADSTHEDKLHRNTSVALESFTAGGQLYAVTGMADQIFVRRNAVSANRSHVWYATESNNGNRIGAHVSSFGSALLANDFTRGVQNLFGNAGTPAIGNVERIDLVVTAGFTATADLAIPVFDFGAPTSHESFKIALITAVDGAGNPAAYSNLAGIGPGWGQTNLYTHNTFSIQRYDAGDDTTSQYSVLNAANQGAGGVAFRLDDFGVAAGTTIHGYSLFGYDVTAGGDSANLLDWTDAAYFPTNTNDGEGQPGGFDFASVNGVFFSAVPEPAAFGLAALLALAASSTLRRRPRAADGSS
jgi:hypothetical protein